MTPQLPELKGALIGMIQQRGKATIICYDKTKAAEILAANRGLTTYEAHEYINTYLSQPDQPANSPCFFSPMGVFEGLDTEEQKDE